jgi:putative protease
MQRVREAVLTKGLLRVELQTGHETATKVSTPHRVPEILAPAGGMAQFFAALNSGADAVFLGLNRFNARARAENFSIEDLRAVTPIAHAHGMRVLVTLNIVLKNHEIPEVIQTLADLSVSGIDAVIVQDLGLVHIIQQYFPSIRIHASTQMAIHNDHGVEAAVAMGIRRVVLARELTANEMKQIRKKFPRDIVELEAFCHGSLCYSYSGLCFFSGAGDGRSGNRGECAYTCRKPYRILNEPGKGFLFSMGDLNTTSSIAKLVEAGIDTLKIEGRKKDAQYVSTSVKLYRDALNSHFGFDTLRKSAPSSARLLAQSETLHADHKMSFSRMPTSFFLNGRYVENVIDLNNPSHSGDAIGFVEHVDSQGFFSFQSNTAVANFDGLKIRSQNKVAHAQPQDGEDVDGSLESLNDRYENNEIQFSVRTMKKSGRICKEAEAGSKLSIQLPEPLQHRVRRGDLVYKVRSNELKTRVEELSKPPQDSRLRSFRQLDFKMHAAITDDNVLTINAEALIGSHVLATCATRFSGFQPSRQQNLPQMCRELFDIFGDEMIMTRSFSFTGVTHVAPPRSELKAFKKELAKSLANLHEQMEQLARAALSNLADGEPIATEGKAERTLSIKFDRIDYLASLTAWIQANASLVEEICYEPKRSLMQKETPAEIAGQVVAFAAAINKPLRIAIPMVTRAWDEPILSRVIKAFYDLGIRRFEVGNVGGHMMLRDILGTIDDLSLRGDFTLYVLNGATTHALRKLGIERATLSVEDDRNNMRLLSDNALPTQVILYKDTPLFIAEACSLTALHGGCPGSAVCGYRELEIENAEGEQFIVSHEACRSFVYSKEAFSLSEHQNDLLKDGHRNFRVDFLIRQYSEEQVSNILDCIRDGKRIPHTVSANFLGKLK